MVGFRWLLCLCVLYACAGLAAPPLRLYTENYPPLNFSRDGQLAGLSVEVVQEILRRTGQQASISLVPWARGYRAAQVEPNSGLFVTMRTEDREKLFKWVGPIMAADTSFYALKGSGLTIDSLEDARHVGTIAVPRQWYSYQVLTAQGMPNLYGVVGPRSMMTMLRHRRVPVAVADSVTLTSLLALGDLKPADVEPLYSFIRSYGYIAFSLSTDDALVEQWQAALDQMKSDGHFARIYQRWLPGQDIPSELGGVH